MTVLLYALVCLIWGSTWLAIKIGLRGVPPFYGAGVRFALAAAILWVMAFIAGKPLRLSSKGRRAAASAGLIGFGLCYALVYWSETRVSSGLVAVLFSLVPLVTAVLTVFVTKTETIGPRKSMGILIGTAGVCALFWPGRGGPESDLLGLAAALTASIGSAFNLVAQSLWSKEDDIRVLNAWSMSIGSALLLALSFCFEQGVAVTWTTTNTGALVYLSIAGSVIAFLSYYRLIRMMPATQVSLITLIFPAVALVLGWLILGERLTMGSSVGIAAIFGGVCLALTERRAPA